MQVLDDVAGGIVEQTHGSLFKWFLDSWPQCWTAHEKVQRAEHPTSNNTCEP